MIEHCQGLGCSLAMILYTSIGRYVRIYNQIKIIKRTMSTMHVARKQDHIIIKTHEKQAKCIITLLLTPAVKPVIALT